MRNTTLYKQTAKSFRLKSSKLFGQGGNLQNVEKSLRIIYIPDEGYVLVQVDQSGAEALIVAYCCRDANYRSLFKNGIKPHSYIAMHLFKDIWPKKMLEHGCITSLDTFDINELCAAPIPSLKTNPLWTQLGKLIKSSDDWALTERYYYLAKQTEHSSNYDIQAPTFQLNILEKSGGKIVISKDQAEFFLLTKHALYPEIKEDYHANVRMQVEKTKMLYNLHGHPHIVTAESLSEKDWKELYSIIPQSTVGEITNIAVTNMQNFIEQEGKRWDVLANTHDSYLIQCPEDEVTDCVIQAKLFMEQKLVSPFDGEQFQMKSEAAVGYNWAPYHKDKNPNGLREV